MKNVLKVVFVIIGTLIGAGFASGQEVYLFFFSYGMKGLIGILISSIIIGVVIYSTFNILNKYKINTYKDFLNILIPKNTKLKIIANFIINIFILITFFIMIAGFGAYFEQEIGINRLVGSLILAIITFIVFMTSIKGVVKVNELIVPILIGFIFEMLDLVYIGIGLTTIGLFFQIITLPVEFNASKRAGKEIDAMHLANSEEKSGIKKVLVSAALTYVAGVLTSALQILRLLLIASSDRD